jgi:hypothetical protein
MKERIEERPKNWGQLKCRSGFERNIKIYILGQFIPVVSLHNQCLNTNSGTASTDWGCTKWGSRLHSRSAFTYGPKTSPGISWTLPNRMTGFWMQHYLNRTFRQLQITNQCTDSSTPRCFVRSLSFEIVAKGPTVDFSKFESNKSRCVSILTITQQFVG